MKKTVLMVALAVSGLAALAPTGLHADEPPSLESAGAQAQGILDAKKNARAAAPGDEQGIAGSPKEPEKAPREHDVVDSFHASVIQAQAKASYILRAIKGGSKATSICYELGQFTSLLDEIGAGAFVCRNLKKIGIAASDAGIELMERSLSLSNYCGYGVGGSKFSPAVPEGDQNELKAQVTTIMDKAEALDRDLEGATRKRTEKESGRH